jgi:hypothetical protein
MACNDRLVPKLCLIIIVGVNVSFQNIHAWTSVTTQNGRVPSVRVWPCSGHELLKTGASEDQWTIAPSCDE